MKCPLIPLLLACCLLAACQREPEPAPVTADNAPLTTAPAAANPAPPPATTASPAAAPTAETAPALEGIPHKIDMPSEQTPTPPLPPSAEVTYVCENGMSLRIAYDGAAARVAWTEGRTLTLSRSAGETYTGDGYVLQRRGNVAMLNQQGGTVSFRCEESTANA